MELEERSDKYVFISYKSEEKELADRIKTFLEQHGFRWWMAPDSLNQVGTQDYSDDIFEAIRGCSCLIFAVSSSALSSKWVTREVRYALDECNKPIIPFVVFPVPEKIQKENSLFITLKMEKQILNIDDTWDMEKVLMPYLHPVFGSGGGIEAPLGQTVSSRGRTSSSVTERIAGTTTIITLPGGAEIEMTYCPPGGFMMGSPTTEEARCDDEDQHHVRLTKGFWLGRSPVTQGQWQSVMGSNPSKFIGDKLLPVDSVSWNDCREFIGKVASAVRLQLDGEARFPTEAEWEYACRAGTTTAYSWGECLKGDKANCNGNYPYRVKESGANFKKTTPVGCYGENAWGLCDLHGNVWEWCADWYGEYAGDAVDPTGPDSGTARVLRRSKGGADKARDRYGFRLCCSVSI